MNEHSVSQRRRGVAHFGSWIFAALLLSGGLASLLHAQISEEDKKKRDAFLKAREEMHTVGSPTPSKAEAAKPKPAKKKSKSAKKDDAETPKGGTEKS